MTWSERPRRRIETDFPHLARRREATPLALLLAASLLVAGLARPASAYAATCEIPAAASRAAPGRSSTPVPESAAIIQIEGPAPAATPASLPAASPVALVEVEPDPLAVLDDELTAVAESLAACLSAGDARGVTDLAGERYLGQIFGSSVPLAAAEYRAIASTLDPVPTRILAVEETARPAEDQATAIVTQVVGNQVLRAEWTFVPAARGERRADRVPWKLSYERTLPVEAPRGADVIDVDIADLAFTLDRAEATGPDIVLRGTNLSSEDHEMLVLKLENGTTTADMLRATGPDLPAGVDFVGEVPVRAGQEQNLVLVDLTPGVYTIVCLFPDADGVPHLSFGMEAAFTVG